MLHRALPIALASLLAACYSDEEPTTNTPPEARYSCGPTLVSDRAWYTSGKVQRLLPGLDGLSYPITMKKELPTARRDSMQHYFDQGLVLAYGFNHAEAARSFWQCTRLDSTCAMGWWGFAYVLGPNYNAGMEADNYERAHAAIGKAQALKGTCNEKEQAFIDAMAKRYAATAPTDRSALDSAYCEAMRAMAARFSDDADVACLFAESLMDQHPWDLYAHNGTEKPWTPEIIAALEHSLHTFPTHFGAHHLYIHAVEASLKPERGLPSAEFLISAVPGAGHLVHMPSHIFIRTGAYHEGVLANQRSVSVDSAYTARCHAAGMYPIGYFPHNIHFLSACATFTGQRALAWRSALDLRAHLARDLEHTPDFATLQHFDAFPWMVAVKLELWKDLAEEAAPDNYLVYAGALWHYAQGVRKARTGDATGARSDLIALRTAMADSTLQPLTIWGLNKATAVLMIAEHGLRGEIAGAQGHADEAVAHFATAVAHEDSLIYQEPPDWTFPTRHELGNAQLKAAKPKDAEQTFLTDLMHRPGNGYALEGLRNALLAQGRTPEADALVPRIAAAWKYANEEATASR